MIKLQLNSPFSWVYGCAHGGKSLIWQASELLFAFFLTEICGLPPREMGLILGLSLLLNAFVDLTMGRILARWIHTVRQAGRVQLIGVCVAGAAFAAFGLSGLIPVSQRFEFALCACLLFRVTYPLVDNPQNAMLALATASDSERARLAAIRYIAAGLAGMAVGGIFSSVIRAGLGQATRFAFFADAIVVIAIVTAIGLTRYTATTQISISRSRLGSSAAVEARVIRALPVFIIIFCFSGCNAVFTRLQPYFAATMLRPADSGSIIMAISAATVGSQFLWTHIARRKGLVWTLRIAIGLWGLASVIFWAVGALGVAPAIVAGLIYGTANGGVLMLLWALAATSAQPSIPRRSATATFGQLTFSSKFAMAISSLALAELLASIDYRDSAIFIKQLLPAMALIPTVGASLSILASAYLHRPGSPSTTASASGDLNGQPS